MKRFIRHRWNKIDGFRTHQCEHCGIVRFWDEAWQKLRYKTKFREWFFDVPNCADYR